MKKEKSGRNPFLYRPLRARSAPVERYSGCFGSWIAWHYYRLLCIGFLQFGGAFFFFQPRQNTQTCAFRTIFALHVGNSQFNQMGRSYYWQRTETVDHWHDRCYDRLQMDHGSLHPLTSFVRNSLLTYSESLLLLRSIQECGKVDSSSPRSSLTMRDQTSEEVHPKILQEPNPTS